MKTGPVSTELVIGTIRAGFAGVLLEDGLPVNNCREPCESTFSKGTTNVRVVAVVLVFDTY